MENTRRIEELEKKIAELQDVIQTEERIINGLQSRLKQTVREYQSLLETCKNINATLDIEKLLQIIMLRAATTTNAETSSIMLVDDAHKEFYFYSIVGERSDSLKTIRFPADSGIAGYVAKTGESVIINDAQNDDRFYRKVDESTSFTTKSMIAAPLFSKEQLIGVIEVINKNDDGAFSETDKELLQALANQAAITIENARLYQNLEKEKKRIEAIVNSMADGVIVTDQNHEIDLINPSAKGMFSYNGHYSENEALKLILEELRSIDDNALTDLVLMQPVRLILSNKLTMMKDEDGDFNGMVFVLRNITELKNAERRKSEFLTVVAHKITEPFEQLVKKLEKSGDDIHTLLQAMQDMIINLIYFSEIESGPMRLGRKKIFLSEIVGSVLERYHGGDIEFTLDADKNISEISVDVQRIEQVFLNLIDNAIRYSDGTRAIVIKIRDLPGEQEISITNYGKSVPEIMLKSIFDKYYHVESYLNNVTENVGLGLAFVQHIIEAHGGKIEVQNLPDDTGAVFTFTLIKD